LLVAALVIDNPKREYWGIKRVAKELKKYNFTCFIISKLIAPKFLKYALPDICILPRVFPDYDRIVGELYQKIDFYHIPSETGLDFENKIINNLYGLKGFHKKHPRHLSKVKKIFIPGEFYNEVLNKNDIYKKEQIKITGSLNSDRWRIEREQGYDYPLFQKKSINIGISTSLKSFVFGIHKSFQELVSLHDISQENIYWRSMILAFETNYIFHLINLIKYFPLVKFNIRPHPHESLKGSKNLYKNLKNVSTNNNIPLEEFIKSNDFIISSFSTTIDDVILHGRIPLSLDKFIPTTIYDAIPDLKYPYIPKNCYRPKNLSEFNELIDNLSNKKAYQKAHNELLNNEYIARMDYIFQLTSKYKTSELIAKYIAENSKIKSFFFKKILKIIFIYILLSFVNFIKYALSNRKGNILLFNIII